MKNIKKGVTPTILGTIVTSASLVSMASIKKKKSKIITAGILGFGLAHIALGGIDLIQKR